MWTGWQVYLNFLRQLTVPDGFGRSGLSVVDVVIGLAVPCEAPGCRQVPAHDPPKFFQVKGCVPVTLTHRLVKLRPGELPVRVRKGHSGLQASCYSFLKLSLRRGKADRDTAQPADLHNHLAKGQSTTARAVKHLQSTRRTPRRSQQQSLLDESIDRKKVGTTLTHQGQVE